jgi:transglutaminase-like putative cysteine protease
LATVVVAALTAALVPAAAANPEVDAAEPRGASIEEIAAAIQKHITEKAAADGGHYGLMHDGRELHLELVRIHMEYLADLGGGVQFACVDLVGTDGPVYDVDFFLAGEPGAMTVTEAPTVHKINGQPLYAWEQKDDGTWGRVAIQDAPPRLLGVVEGEDEFEFIYRVRLPELAGAADLWMPLARSDAFQSVEVTGIDAPTKTRQLEEDTYGNKILYLSVGPENSGQAIEVRYRVRRVEKSPYPTASPSTRRDLGPERLVPNRDDIRASADSVTQAKTTDLMRARALYDHVIGELRYAKFGTGWGKGDVAYACTAKSGNCSDFHSYFVALARSVGIPARFVAGISIPSERDAGGIDGYHCWAEFLADGRWWPVDLSEADKNASLATYYFGHQPANRMELSQGRDLVVEPGPASGPINFLAYPVLEVEGRLAQAKTEFLFRRVGTRDGKTE